MRIPPFLAAREAVPGWDDPIHPLALSPESRLVRPRLWSSEVWTHHAPMPLYVLRGIVTPSESVFVVRCCSDTEPTPHWLNSSREQPASLLPVQSAVVPGHGILPRL